MAVRTFAVIRSGRRTRRQENKKRLTCPPTSPFCSVAPCQRCSAPSPRPPPDFASGSHPEPRQKQHKPMKRTGKVAQYKRRTNALSTIVRCLHTHARGASKTAEVDEEHWPLLSTTCTGVLVDRPPPHPHPSHQEIQSHKQ